ncbi:MAG: penicillin acylase family protein [Pseudomonadota bacterium]
MKARQYKVIMRRLVSGLYYLIIGGVTVFLIGLAFVYFLFSRSLPDYDIEREVAAVEAPIEIVRDTFNIPHIFAQSEHDALFALGYANAQDRLWQMELRRREAQGRMAEIFGESALPSDRIARHLGFYRNALSDARTLPRTTREALEAYADGVNAYLTELSNQPRGRGAPEFYFLTPQIAPWRAADSLAILRHWAWQNSGGLTPEILKARVLLAAGPDLTEEFFGDATLTRSIGMAVAVTAERSVTGSVNMVADLHGPLSAPSYAYAAHVQTASSQQTGLTIPGIPALLMGSGPSRSFAMIPRATDTMDLAIIPDELLPRSILREERIVVEGAATHTESIRTLASGVVLDPELFGLSAIVPADHSAVLQWTGLNPLDDTFGALIDISFGADGALEPPQLERTRPPLTLAYADRSGLLSFDLGELPSRSPWQGKRSDIPYLAERVDALWSGTKPIYDENASTVVQVIDAQAPLTARLDRLLSLRDIHSLQSLKDIQFDAVSQSARGLLPLMARELWFSETVQAEEPTSELRSKSLELLADWNGEMSEHLPQPLIYSAWLWEFYRQVIRDELGPVSAEFLEPNAAFLRRVYMDEGGLAHWCDIKPSSEVESCDDIALRSLNVSLLRLSETYGPRVESWLWGDAHTGRHAHPLFTEGSMMDWASGIYQPLSGDSGTLNQTPGTSEDGVSFRPTSAPVARIAIDLSQADQSGLSLSTGQSGHFLSPYYDNFAPLWRRGEYIPISFDDDIIRAGAVGTTRFTPSN